MWTFDPREHPSTIPFDLWPQQEAFLRWLGEREAAQESGLVEKSRDAGLTWLCAAYAVHGWLFRHGFSAGFGSRKLDLVDRIGDPDTIFEKTRGLLREVPDWMLPEGFDWKKHDNYARLLNPETGASITGEGGDEIGRGGRKTIYFVDESAFLLHGDKIDRALSATTNTRIDVSTPNGPGNAFYRKRFGGGVPVFSFHWSDDPRKNEAWAMAKKAEIGPIAFAQEYDLDYSASIEGIFIPAAWVRAAVELDLPESGHPVAGEDIAEEGGDDTVLTFARGPVVTKIVDWRMVNTTQTAYRTVDACTAEGAKRLNYDADGVGTGPKGIWASMDPPPPFTIVPIHNGGTPSESTYWPDGKTSAEKFANRKAELWWMMRCRFERTYEYVEQGVNHPPEDMISIPNHPTLIGQLSMPKVEYNDRGKIAVESKKSLRARGVKSPDHAESLVYCFAPDVDWGFGGPDITESATARPPGGAFYEPRRDRDSDRDEPMDIMGMRL